MQVGKEWHGTSHVFMLSSMCYPTLPVSNELVGGVGACDGVQAGPGLLQGLQLGLNSLHCHLMPIEQAGTAQSVADPREHCTPDMSEPSPAKLGIQN